MKLNFCYSFSGASYDERNLPVEFNYQVNKRNLSAHWWMGYDSGALRVYKADQLGNTTHFVRDINGIEPAPMKIGVIASYYNGALRYHGLLGPEGSPDFIGSQANSTSRYYFLKDHPSVDGQVLSSVRTTVDFSNTALGYDDYYPFGKVMPGRSSSSSTPDDDYPDFIGTGHTLSAHWRKRDAELDLDYSSPERSRRVLARNYDPLIGRFMQVDPALLRWTWQDNLNKNNYAISPYGYVRNNPMIKIDLDGYTDWYAFFRGAARSAFSATTVASGYTMILAGSGVTAASLGASTPVSVPTVMTGIGGVVYGTAEFAFGIVDMRVAWHTPDGMSAESMRSLLSIITKGVTDNEKAANIVSLIESFKSAGTIPKSIKNDQILEAVYNLQNLIDDATKVVSDIKTTEQKEKENEDDEKN